MHALILPGRDRDRDRNRGPWHGITTSYYDMDTLQVESVLCLSDGQPTTSPLL
jgi:hypothetical protein